MWFLVCGWIGVLFVLWVPYSLVGEDFGFRLDGLLFVYLLCVSGGLDLVCLVVLYLLCFGCCVCFGVGLSGFRFVDCSFVCLWC